MKEAARGRLFCTELISASIEDAVEDRLDVE